MGERPVRDPRCAHCSAALRPGAPWCTQCYARTADAPPAPAPAAAVPAGVPAPRTAPDAVTSDAVASDPVTSDPATSAPATSDAAPSHAVTRDRLPAPRPAPADAGATWPCEACGARSPLTETRCTGCGTGFLAHARGPRPAIVLPLVGDVSALTPLRLVAVALALVVGLLLAGVVAGALLV